MTKRFVVIEMFYRRLLTISWTDDMSKADILRKMETKGHIFFKSQKGHLTFLGCIMWKGGSGNFTLTGHIKIRAKEENSEQHS